MAGDADRRDRTDALTSQLGIAVDEARKSPDFRHLHDQAALYRESPERFVANVRALALARTESSELAGGFERAVIGCQSSTAEGVPPHLVAEAIQIVGSDVTLLDEVRGYAPPEVVRTLVDELPKAAIGVAKRLTMNVVGELNSRSETPTPVDPQRVRPLRDIVEPGRVDRPHPAPIDPQRAALVIATAGRGTRLRTTIPKALIPLGGRPLLSSIIASARSIGIATIVVVLKHGAELHPPVFGRELTYVHQREALGTGHSFASGLAGVLDHPVCVLSYSDTPFLTAGSFGRVGEAVREGQAAMAMLAVDADLWPEYGRLIERDGFVRSIEQPRFGFAGGGRADAGLYAVAPKRVFEPLLATRNHNHRYEYSFTEVVRGLDPATRPALAVTTSDFREALGINRPADLVAARRIIGELRAECEQYRTLGATFESALTPSQLLATANRLREAVDESVGALIDLRPQPPTPGATA